VKLSLRRHSRDRHSQNAIRTMPSSSGAWRTA